MFPDAEKSMQTTVDAPDVSDIRQYIQRVVEIHWETKPVSHKGYNRRFILENFPGHHLLELI
jgi:hypothetical protein